MQRTWPSRGRAPPAREPRGGDRSVPERRARHAAVCARHIQEAGVEEGDLGLSESEQGMDHDPAALRDVADFDCAFMEMMIPHHEGAIRMARAELRSGIHAELRRMSENIIDSQSFEIRQMKRFQSQWCDGSSSEHPSGTREHGG